MLAHSKVLITKRDDPRVGQVGSVVSTKAGQGAMVRFPDGAVEGFKFSSIQLAGDTISDTATPYADPKILMESISQAGTVGDVEPSSERLERHGKWFLVSTSLLPEIKYEDVCDIYSEFLRSHPNGGMQTQGYICVRLSDEQIKQYRERLRISSYRWADFKGVGPKGDEKVIPGNYLWFLEYIRERKLILWMDWMANVGVNVPVSEVIGYMGSLYAESIVLGEWMFDIDKLGVGLTRAWIFQEMAFGALDKEAMLGLLEQLRERGRTLCRIPYGASEADMPLDRYGDPKKIRRIEPKDAEVVQTYVLGCGFVASLLGRRAFNVVARECKWFQDVLSEPTHSLRSLGIGDKQAKAALDQARAELPFVDEAIWGRLLLLLSTTEVDDPTSLRPRTLDWTDRKWRLLCPELLELICGVPYRSCKTLDELMLRYAQGLLGAALGCQVTYETDRAAAVSTVVQAIASEQFSVKISAEELLRRAWKTVLDQMTTRSLPFFKASQVKAPIKADALSFALSPLKLHGSMITFGENTYSAARIETRDATQFTAHQVAEEGKLVCHYNSFGRDTFSEHDGRGLVCNAVSAAGLRGIASVDGRQGLPKKPLPKPQDETGAEANLFLCVPNAEPFVTAAEGLAFVLITQTHEEGEHVISMYVGLNGNGRIAPPKPDIRFFPNRLTGL